MAEIYDFLGKPDNANALRSKASVLFNKFNEAFWDEETGFYAYALDGDKRQVRSVASNPGLCLWSCIVPPERAERVVTRLLARDMCSGWGMRITRLTTLFLPERLGLATTTALSRLVSGGMAFQRRQHASRVKSALYSGIECTETNFPVQYLGANAASVGGGLGVRLPPGNSWFAAGCSSQSCLPCSRSKRAKLSSAALAATPAASWSSPFSRVRSERDCASRHGLKLGGRKFEIACNIVDQPPRTIRRQAHILKSVPDEFSGDVTQPMSRLDVG